MVLKFESHEYVSQKRPQILTALGATIGSFVFGNCIGWSSPALPKLWKTEEFSGITHSEISWIASLLTLGGVFGGLVGGYMLDRLGRQFSLFLLCFPFAISWFLIAFGSNVLMLYTGRFVAGICCGAYCVVLTIYLSEIAEESIRGLICSLFPAAVSLGILSTFVLGSFVSWKVLSLVCASVPVINILTITWAPESPTFLILKGKRRCAGLSLMRLRGAETFSDIEPELAQIESSVGNNSRTKLTARDYFCPQVLKPLGVCSVLMVLQQFAGINSVIFYTVDIFQSSGTEIDPNLASTIVAIVLLFGMLASVIFIERAGRRILLLISASGCCLCLVGLGIFFYLQSSNGGKTPEFLGWLPLTSLIVYAISFNVGIGPVPWTLMAELNASHVKGTASAFVTSFNWFLAFLVTKFYLQLSEAFGLSSCYFMFAGNCALGAVFTYFIVPETKGKTFEEIQKSFL